MKKLGAILMVACMLTTAAPVLADTYVEGYYSKEGTYVGPHHRSDRDGNPYNNWSTRGNTNPYTGDLGTREPYSPPNYSYY